MIIKKFFFVFTGRSSSDAYRKAAKVALINGRITSSSINELLKSVTNSSARVSQRNFHDVIECHGVIIDILKKDGLENKLKKLNVIHKSFSIVSQQRYAELLIENYRKNIISK